MNKSEFLERLRTGLERSKIPDAADIADEYEQHFAFKLADGFSEEEIAARLGDPAALAAQFGAKTEKKTRGGNRAITVLGLCLSGIGAGIFFVLLAAWGAALAAFALGSAAAAVCLAAGSSPWGLLPPMPRLCAAICGIALLALAVLAAVGCIWFAAFLRQLLRAYGRFHRNALSVSAGQPPLPPIAAYPGFPPKTKRRLRRAALISLSAFAAFFVLGLTVSMCYAGSLEFWHAWGWFGYAA